MANPRLNLPFVVGRQVSDDQIAHLIRTLREWSRYVDTAIAAIDTSSALTEAEADALYVNVGEFNTLGDARYYTETETDTLLAAYTAADTALDTRLDSLEADVDTTNTTWASPFATGVTVGSGTVTAQYSQVGKIVACYLKFVFGSGSAITGDVSVTLPVTAAGVNAAQGLGHVFDTSGATRYAVHVHALTTTTALVRPMDSSATFITISGTGLSSTVPFTWATGDEIRLNLTYLAA